ncbi:MAG TPA: alpha/beta hydrolase [Candidatus Limnocylindria bacterium]
MRRLATILIAVIVLGWALVPAVRAALLVRHGAATAATSPLSNVTFAASDGVPLVGTYMDTASARSAVILVHGFKNTRADMLDYAAFLHDAGYAVLLYDSRGCGASGGTFGVGATEDRDVAGAVSYLKTAHPGAARRIAVLGVSLGAGDAILAGARDGRIDAVIADSSWADERVQLERMDALAVGPLTVPLLPYEPALVDALVGARLEDARPRDEVGSIAPRPLFLIHSADDENATTTAADTDALFAAAREPKTLWIAPRGGHAGAVGAQRDEYVRRVLAFLAQALG